MCVIFLRKHKNMSGMKFIRVTLIFLLSFVFQSQIANASSCENKFVSLEMAYLQADVVFSVSENSMTCTPNMAELKNKYCLSKTIL